jgi:hypothetical protein
MAKSARALSFLPVPKIVEYSKGAFALAGDRFIALTGAPASQLMFTAHRLQAALAAHAGVTWALTASGVAEEIGIAYTIDPRCASDLPATRAPDEAYELLITPDGVIIRSPSPRGAWNATLTLIQIVEQAGPSLPCLRIADAPDFPNRGVLLDVTRDKVPTLDTLFELVDLLASWKINEIQLYTEHTFAYRRHRTVWDYPRHDRAGHPRTRRLLPGALHRPRPQPELTRPHGTLAAPSGLPGPGRDPRPIYNGVGQHARPIQPESHRPTRARPDA